MHFCHFNLKRTPDLFSDPSIRLKFALQAINDRLTYALRILFRVVCMVELYQCVHLQVREIFRHVSKTPIHTVHMLMKKKRTKS